MAAKNAIVIGGGIAGCSTAYALAQRGLEVTLLERNAQIAGEASGNPLAMLYPRLNSSDSATEFALAAYLHSLRLYRSLGLPAADFDCCGMLQLGFNPKESARIRKVAAQGHASSIVEYADRTQASELAGIDIEHDALHFPDAAWVNPQQLCRRLTRHENITTATHENVFSIRKINDSFEVISNQNSVHTADIVVIANANSARQLYPELQLNIQAVRGQVSLVSATGASRPLQKIVCSDGYLSPATYRRHAEQLHCLGATFSNIAAGENTLGAFTVENQDHLANLEKLHHISGSLHAELKDHITGGRVSLRCAAMDYWPLAGQLLDAGKLNHAPPRANANAGSLPWVDGLYMNIAHGSKGFTTAPLCAELIACMALGQALPVPDALAGLLNPNRFQLRQMGLKRLAKMMPA
ncbi:FAD-dependent 5-carboxymethylaminomethyl-2-thiouridine(34) oxidoreductase MnmC [Methylotenera sp. G11]|uniref:FAD-dependent 5-carboxymethylaminomethyl-2-thiouridine(34) oxidoreductase MnmC n=1 Tax=Methylotenera sp. G11 TaxID=1506585 RepID=UPI00064613D8|nr:FAD-dependent 5-carboxymethylaminomethyl-2-thiouridine(34) oxidoreductase MnmC [Methylotenera sp. G11]